MKAFAAAAAALLFCSSCPEPFGAFSNPVDSSNKVAVTAIALNLVSASLEVGQTLQLSASLSPPTATIKSVTWSTAAPSVASVSAQGLVTGLAVGGTTITARSVDTGLTVSCSIAVKPISVVSVSLPGVGTVLVGRTTTLVPTILPASAADKAVSWASSDPAKASVAVDGTVTGVAEGQATITVTTRDGGVTASCAVTVAPVRAVGLSLDRSTATLNVWDEAQLSPIFSPADATDRRVDWTSSSTAVAAVSATGLVAGASEGDAIVTARARDGGFEASCAVRVNRVAVTGISVEPARLDLAVRGTAPLSATILPSNATNKGYTWSSGDASVAAVSGAGLVTGVGAGSTFIEATSSEGAFVALCETTVRTVAVDGIYLIASDSSLFIGDTLQLDAVVTPADATERGVQWSSDAPTIASVSASGLVSGLSEGSATITATSVDGSYRANRAIAVRTRHVTGVQLDTSSASILRYGTRQLHATVSPDDATDASVIWNSSDASVATVSAEGIVTAVAEGAATVTVTTSDGGYTATCQVTVYVVHVSGITVQHPVTGLNWGTFGSWTMMKGNYIYFPYTISPADATDKVVSWSTSNSLYVTVTQTGSVYGKNSGSATITIRTRDGGMCAYISVFVQ